jgi:hypothetical protein
MATDYSFWFIDRDGHFGILFEDTVALFCNYCPCPFWVLKTLHARVEGVNGLFFDEDIEPSTDYSVPILLNVPANCNFRIDIPPCIKEYPVSFDWSWQYTPIVGPDQWWSSFYQICSDLELIASGTGYTGQVIQHTTTIPCTCLEGSVTNTINRPLLPNCSLLISWQYELWKPECDE